MQNNRVPYNENSPYELYMVCDHNALHMYIFNCIITYAVKHLDILLPSHNTHIYNRFDITYKRIHNIKCM